MRARKSTINRIRQKNAQPKQLERYRPLQGGAFAMHVKAPAGGVPAFNTTTGQMGSATCPVYLCSGTGVLTSAGRSVKVYNAAGAVAADAWGIALRNSAGLLVFIVERC